MSENNELEDRLIAVRAVGPLEQPPVAALERARRLFRLYQPPQPEGLGTRLARLIQDSFRAPATLAAVRGTTLPETRELLFEAGELLFRLYQEPMENQQWFLIGQLLGPAERPIEGIRAQLEPGGLEAQELGAGELHFESVAPGRYTLRLHLPEGVTLFVPEVPVGEV